MAIDVWVVGLWDDYMSYWLLDKAEWDKLDRRSMQERNFTTIASWELLEFLMDPEEFAEYKAENETIEGSIEDSLDINQLIELVKLGKINIMAVAEGLDL